MLLIYQILKNKNKKSTYFLKKLISIVQNTPVICQLAEEGESRFAVLVHEGENKGTKLTHYS